MASEIEREFNRRLAREVSNHPCLYNSAVKYGPKNIKDAWIKVANELKCSGLDGLDGLDDRQCEKKWQALRKDYIKSIKAGRHPYNAQEMSFLLPYMRSTETFEPLPSFTSTPLCSQALNAGSMMSPAESDVSMRTVTGSDVTMRTASEAGESETDTSTIQDDHSQIEDLGPQALAENASRENSNIGFDHSPAMEHTLDEENHNNSSTRSSRTGTPSTSRRRSFDNMTRAHAWMDTFHESMRDHLLEMNSRQQLSYKSQVTSIVQNILDDNGTAN